MTIHYHYTSVETLFKIVQNRTWRFTNVRFMNDGNEFHFGWKLMQRHEPRIAQICVAELVLPFWVSCFSKSDDSFSQWSMYGDGGAGVAIGIDTEHFGNSIVRPGIKGAGPHPFETLEIVYDKDQQEELIRQELANHKKVFDGPNFIADLPREILQLPIQFKQHNFKAEEEVRCVQFFPVTEPATMGKAEIEEWREFASEYLKYAWRKGRIVPFLEVPWTHPDVLRKIVTGPKFSQGSNRQMLVQFLQLHGFDNLEITHSKIEWGV